MATQKHILIVDDEKALSHALDLKLQHEGFTTSVAHNGDECLKALEKDAYDIVLLDVMMPVLDGFQVLERLKNMPTKPTVFVLSNLSQGEDEARVYELGAKKYFVKSNTPLSVIVDEVKKL